MTTAELETEKPPTRRRRPSWAHSPQRVFLRRAIFQVHLWCGILVAAYAIVIGLTGSALVFRSEMVRSLQPGLYHIAPVRRQISLDTAVHRIETARPGWTAFAMRDFDRTDQATDLLLRATAGKPTPNYRIVSFSPYTGAVLLDRLRYAGFLGFLDNLHVYLLSGETGLLVSGWMALGLLLLCLTGLILWWRGVERWATGLLLPLRTNWRRLNWDLHTVLGFWSSLAFLVIIVTGLDFAFPGPAGKTIELFTGGGFHDTGVSLAAIGRKPAIGHAPILTIDQAVAAAYRSLPPDAPPGYLQFPATPTSPYRATGYYKEAAPYSQLVRILFDAHTGKLLALSDTRSEDLGSRIEQYCTAVHFGLFGGPGLLGFAAKVLWVLLGIVPAVMAFTGLLMYWNRTLHPAWRRMAQRR